MQTENLNQNIYTSVSYHLHFHISSHMTYMKNCNDTLQKEYFVQSKKLTNSRIEQSSMMTI